jgi:uncharacterized protein (TIGR02302 family)
VSAAASPTPSPAALPGAPPHRYRLAYLALLWEAIWPALWPALAVAGLFLLVALVDVLPELNPWLHGAVLALFGIGFAIALVRGIGTIRLPSLAGARRRLETANQLRHRPLTALQDRPAGGDVASRALWQAHLARMAAQVRVLKIGVPEAGLASRDPIGLRAGLVLGLLVAGLFAGLDGWDRIGRALTPGLGHGVAVPTTLDVWVTPPAYTGLPPLLASGLAPDQTLMVPAGSSLLAQAGGLRSAPSLAVGGQTTAFTPIESGNFRLEATLTQGDRLSIVQGRRELAGWPMHIVADQPPTIAFKQPPGRTNRAALRLDYTAKDDYGLETATAIIRRSDKPDLDPLELALPLPGKRRDAQGTSYHDLTAHPWSGLPVTIQLQATDAIGQSGVSEAASITLPERTFTHPVARAIVEQRKILVLDPEKKREVGQALARIAALPRLYGDDTVVFMALMSARARLAFEVGDGAIEPVQQLLWDTAIHIEEGEVGLRERDLRAAEQAVRDAIARNAPDPELQKLIDEMQQALDRFIDSMLQQALQTPTRERIPRDRNAQMVDRRDLQRMLDKARELARRGQREQAQALLNQLQQMLENMRAGVMDDADDMDDGSEMSQAMQGLQDLARRQRDLLDRAFRKSNRGQRGQRGQPGQQGQQGQQSQQGDQGEGEDGDEGDLAGDQESLRRALGDMMRRLGEAGDIPGALGRAERAMRDATDALNRGAPGQATGPQGEALDQLREGARSLADQMQQGQGEGDQRARGRADSSRQQGPGRDPFGRPMPNATGVDTGDVAIPDEGQMERAREIYDELRRRAADPNRPGVERDYLDRLMRRF